MGKETARFYRSPPSLVNFEAAKRGSCRFGQPRGRLKHDESCWRSNFRVAAGWFLQTGGGLHSSERSMAEPPDVKKFPHIVTKEIDDQGNADDRA
jgi:hypothetical protein